MGTFKVKGSPYYHFAFQIRGTRYRGSTYLAKKADAVAFEANERRRVQLGEGDYDILTLEQAFNKYEEEHAMFLASYASIQAHVDHMLDHWGKGRPIHDIDQNELERYVAKCRTELLPYPEDGERKKLSAATVNRRLATFQGMHRRARDSWKAKVALIDFRALRLKEATIVNNTLCHEDVQALWDAAPEQRHFIAISLYTGWRMTNVLTLRGNQIDLDNLVMQTIGKRQKLITSPITREFAAYIRLHKLHEKELVCDFWGDGEPVKSIKTAWRTLFTKTKVKRIRVHDLRHTFGTWLYESTGDQRLVQELLHHSDIKTTIRYTHTKQELQRAKLDKATTLKIKSAK